MIPLGVLLFQLMFGAVRVDADSTAAPIVHAVPTPTGPYHVASLDDYLEDIRLALLDSGYAYPILTMASVTINADSTRIHFDVRVVAGSPVRIDGLVLSGTTRYPPERIRFRLPDRTGRIATRQEREALRRDLLATGVFRTVDAGRPVYRNGQDVIDFRVEDLPPGHADGIIGWNDGTWVGSLDVRVRHAMAIGHIMSIRLDRTRPLETDLAIHSDWDRIRSTRYGGDAHLAFTQQDSTYLVLSLAAGADRSDPGGARYGVWLERRQVKTGDLSTPDLAEGRLWMAGVRYRSNTLSDPFFPISGSRFHVQAGSGFRDRGDAVSRLTGAWEMVVRSWNRTATLINGGIGIFEADSIRLDERFRIGGASSVRGMPEASIRSAQYLWSDVEWRRSLDRETYAFLFSGGTVASGRDPLVNVGFGFAYVTRAGVFRITAAGASADWRQPVVHVRLSTGL